MKKLVSAALALALTLSMSTVAFAAENKDPKFTKSYSITNTGTENPAETFQFQFTANHVTDNNNEVTMPNIPNATVEYAYGEATTDGLKKDITLALNSINWPDVGVYYYKMKEVAGNTAGVKYDAHEAWLKVTVAVDESTGRFYTAFVTINLDEKDAEGNTKVKTDTFSNVYSAGELDISKTVTGNMGDKNNYFEVYVTLEKENNTLEYLDSYKVEGGSNESNPKQIKLGEKTTFLLKHGDTIKIKNLPYGVTYKVEEKDYTDDGYKATLTGENGKMNAATETAAITNDKTVGVDTGIVLDSMPYVLMLVVAGAGLAVFFFKKRMMHEN